MYDLIPYVSDKDFEAAQTMQIVSDTNKEYQVRFNYWIGQFEALYGDIVTFFKELGDQSTAEKLKQINDLILILINKQSG